MGITKSEWIQQPSMSSSRFIRDILPAGECSIIAQVGGQGQETDIDNARLIAAAPALLEFAKMTVDNKNEPDKLLCQIERFGIQAIAKAEALK